MSTTKENEGKKVKKNSATQVGSYTIRNEREGKTIYIELIGKQKFTTYKIRNKATTMIRRYTVIQF